MPTPYTGTRLLGGTSNAESVIQAQATCRRLDNSAHLLGGGLDTGVRQVQAIPEDVTLPVVEPSGSTASPAFRPDHHRAFRPDHTNVLAPTPGVDIDAVVDVDAHAPQSLDGRI